MIDPDTADKLGDLADRAERQRKRFHARQPRGIKNIVNQVITTRGYANRQGSEQLQTVWNDAIGEPFAPLTQVAGMKRGVLEILVANSTLLQEINFQRPQLLKKIQQQLPEAKITSLRFRIGKIRKR